MIAIIFYKEKQWTFFKLLHKKRKKINNTLKITSNGVLVTDSFELKTFVFDYYSKQFEIEAEQTCKDTDDAVIHISLG